MKIKNVLQCVYKEGNKKYIQSRNYFVDEQDIFSKIDIMLQFFLIILLPPYELAQIEHYELIINFKMYCVVRKI